jgi:hypothetical protein
LEQGTPIHFHNKNEETEETKEKQNLKGLWKEFLIEEHK